MLIRTEEGHPSQRAYLCLQQVRTLEKLGIPRVPGQSRISGQRQTHLDIALGRSCVDSPGHAAARRSREGQRLIQRLARFSETPLKHLAPLADSFAEIFNCDPNQLHRTQRAVAPGNSGTELVSVIYTET